MRSVPISVPVVSLPSRIDRPEALHNSLAFTKSSTVPVDEIRRRMALCLKCPRHERKWCPTCAHAASEISRAFGPTLRPILPEEDRKSGVCTAYRAYELAVASVAFAPSDAVPEACPATCWRRFRTALAAGAPEMIYSESKPITLKGTNTMNYPDAISSLTGDGRAVKPVSWRGYVARVETAPTYVGVVAAGGTSITYSKGQLVQNPAGTEIHSCKQALTITAGAAEQAWDTVKSDYWTKVMDIIPTFSSSTSTNYSAGDQVKYSSAWYECTAATTGGTFDTSKWTQLSSDHTHLLSFVENSDVQEPSSSGDSVIRYNLKVTVTASGTTYGAFDNDLKIDSVLFKAMTADSTWTSGNASDFEIARSGSQRW